MTISTTASRISYNGNGATTAFAFPYRFFTNGDLVVILVASDGTETTQVLNTDYTVAGADADAGGTVTMVVAPASGERLVIYRSTAITQEVDYISGDPFPAETHERALDRLTIISQQLQDGLDRAAKLPETSTEDADALVADLIRLADSADNINTVAGSIGNVNTVAGSIASVNTAASNIAAIIAAPAEAASAASSASSASTSETNAANSASAASTSATNAANSASAAATSESNAASSASAAATSASNAATSASNAAASAAAAATFDPANFVDLVNNQTIGGTKTFSNTITGSISGNAATATSATSATTATNIAGGAAGNIPVQTATGTTSFYTGQLAGMRNKIINGKMEIAQRGTSFAAAADGAYTLDRWFNSITGGGVVTVSQQSDVPSSNEFQSSLRSAVTTADTSIAAGDYAGLVQHIEGYNVRDLIGKTFTLSFWVRSSKTGVHCVSFRNAGAPSSDRSYVSEYTVSAANTWEYKTVTVSGGLITAGTWNWTNGIGLRLFFAMAIGSTFQTTAGAWQTGNFYATANQVNCLDTVGNIFAITGVQLEVGSVATPFEHRPYGAELALCQRYFYSCASRYAGRVIGTGALPAFNFPVPMRTPPTASGTTAADTGNNGTFATQRVSIDAVEVYNSASNWTTNAAVAVTAGFSAEL